MYIASPPSESPFITKLVEKLKIEHENTVYLTTKQLSDWLSNHQIRNCRYARIYNSELVSILEQAILANTKKFFPWPSSSWSGRVIQLRPEKVRMKERGFSLTDLIERSMDLEREHAEEF